MNEQLTETIEKALEAVIQGDVHLFGLTLIALTNEDIVGSRELARCYDNDYAVIFSNAPEWLRALLEENKRLRFGSSPIEPLVKLQLELQQTREELQQKKERVNRLRESFNREIRKSESLLTELEQVKAELEKAKLGMDGPIRAYENRLAKFESLRTELSAKDKVLEEISTMQVPPNQRTTALGEVRSKARTILYQFGGNP